MKKIKVIPFIISILFPLVCTAFIVCYSYGVNDIYTNNKDKYEVYFQNKYYNDKGEAEDEIGKAVKLDSYKYQASPANVKFYDDSVQSGVYHSDDLSALLYGYTTHTETKKDDEKKETTVDIAYSLYIYDILYKNKYTNSDDFKNTSGLLLKDKGSLALICVKGTGGAAEERLENAKEEIERNGSTSKATLITASSVSIYDNNAKNYKDPTDEKAVPKAYRFQIFNSQNETNTEFYNFDDLEELYEGEEVNPGYTFSLVNLYDNTLIREIALMTLTDVVDGKTFETKENIETGYRNDYTLAGYSYIGYVWPTLLWQGALTLLLTGVLAVLFYAIWQTDPEVSQEQVSLKQLQKNKKQQKKKKK